MLVYFEPAKLCELPADFVIAPLPAKKSLWEANSELDWRLELAKTLNIQDAYGLTTSGQVVKFDDHHDPSCHSLPQIFPTESNIPFTGNGNWQEWCSGMDGLGGLVLLAASLVT